MRKQAEEMRQQVEETQELQRLFLEERTLERRSHARSSVVAILGILLGVWGFIGLGTFLEYFFGAPFFPSQYPEIGLGVVAILGFVVSAALPLANAVSDRNKRKRERQAVIGRKKKQLGEAHPELADLLDLLEFSDETSGRRSFWSSVAQNAFFFGLGVAVPIALTYFHLFQ